MDDIKESLTYLFKDNKWITKFFICFVFIGIITYCGYFTLSPKYNKDFGMTFAYWFPMTIAYLITKVILDGYKIANIKIYQGTKSNYVIPYVNLKTNFVLGFKFALANFFFNIACYAIIAILGLATGLSMYGKNKAILLIFPILLITSILIYTIYITFTALGYENMFAKNPSLLCFFKIKELFSNIMVNVKKYILCFAFYLTFIIVIILLNFLTGMLFGKINTIIALVVCSLIISAFTTYWYYVECMLATKSIQNEVNQSEV